MTQISAEMVKNLRERTGAGMLDCKAALSEANGSLEGAIEILRKKGLKDINKRSGKTAAEGTLGVYIHAGEQVVSVVELNCETDFVARGEEFKRVAKDLAMHIAAMRPSYVSVEEIPAEVINKEKEIAIEQLSPQQRDKADKILPGKLEQFFAETALLNQTFVKDESKTIKQIVDELSMKVGEKVVVRRFHRYQVGEGIERAVANLAEEVAAMTAGN